ncbi:MAG: hypothetical protein NVSMB9_13570 [Isosphaeraceae bacterium]
MRVGLASVNETGGQPRLDQTIRRLEEAWEQGRPDLRSFRNELTCDGGSLTDLADLIKADLCCRYARGETAAINEYLGWFPELRENGERVLSLVYEEYCLREERGERVDTEEFCERYAPWKDSLASQLRYHRVISRVVGATAPTRFPEPGDKFEEFRICAELGRGGAARVYLARDESLGSREVALKVSTNRGDEPAILGRLTHPHIITVHSVAVQADTGLRGLCMPYRPGLPLDELLRRIDPARRPEKALALHEALVSTPSAQADGGSNGLPDSWSQGPGWDTFPTHGSYSDGIAWVGATLAEALAYAHGQGIFHRDVKPANVLLTYREGPQLLDFNLSHDPHSAVQAEAALRGGTLPYMAPEQLEAFLDPQRWETVVGSADIYSLGLLLRELLTGQAPETPDPSLPLPRAIRRLLDHRVGFDHNLRQFNRAIPHALEAIVERCLAFLPAERYQDARALAEDLRLHLARRPLKHAQNRSKRERAWNWLGRHRTRLAVAVLAVAIIPGLALRSVPSPVASPSITIRNVADALANNRVASALSMLESLREPERSSPLAAFYKAAALARSDRSVEADAELERAFTFPGAETFIAEGARNLPGFESQAEYLGALLVSDRSLVANTPGREGVLGRAERSFRLALRVDPRRFWPRQGLALIDEKRRQFPAAHRNLTQLIQENPATSSKADRSRLQSLLQSRARVSVHWAVSLLPAFTSADGSSSPAPHLQEALTDLNHADQLTDAVDRQSHFALNYIRCEALLALGETARLDQRDADARRFSREADSLLIPLQDHDRGEDLLYADLFRKVKDWQLTKLRVEDRLSSDHTRTAGG